MTSMKLQGLPPMACTKRAPRTRVVVAMSGGVDSSVAAALLVEEGHDVIGVMMRLWAEDETNDAAPNRCCSPEAMDGARQVCYNLGIPFYVVDFRRPFREKVVDYFLTDYAQGRTPNPCVACNQRIKFDLLLQWALALDARFLATGHYARAQAGNGQYHLLEGLDLQKDQSYVLYMLGQRHLRHLLLPLGVHEKKHVRAMADERGLPTASRPESQELCFVQGNDYRRFLRRHRPEAFTPGPIVNTAREILGQHKGLPCYTIGQRKGMGIAAAKPLYVLRLDLPNNTLIVGGRSQLGRRELLAVRTNYVSGRVANEPSRIEAKIRYKAVRAPARLLPTANEEATVVFDQPQRDITPGQSVVFYRGQEVLGGGVIA